MTPPLRVVIAPDSFKGTLTAREATTAIARGWASIRPDDRLILRPMADGGEGTIDALHAAHPSAHRAPVLATGPDDHPVTASVLLLEDTTAVVELAATSGLTLLDRPRPDTAHSRGFGQAIRAALDLGATRLLLAIGGSGSIDGGLGLLTELGATVHRRPGSTSGFGNSALAHVTDVDLRGALRPPDGGAVILSDVASPLLGPAGAVAIFGAQKGVCETESSDYELRLAHWAGLVAPHLVDAPGAGAAGGAGFALQAWGARHASGAMAVAAALRLPEALASADVVITGEGRYDAQTQAGKVVSVVTALAGTTPVLLVAGAVTGNARGFDAAVALTDLALADTGDTRAAMHTPTRYAYDAGAALALSRG